MPIYEYQCSRCGGVFEAFQKINDAPLTGCKFCDGEVEKLISQSSFQLKGSGWYLTDYSRKSGSPGSSTDSGSKSGEKTESSTKADTGSTSSTATTPKT